MRVTSEVRLDQATWSSNARTLRVVMKETSEMRLWNKLLSHARASLFPSYTSLVSFVITRSVRALEDHFAWSSRTSLVTLMSGARATS